MKKTTLLIAFLLVIQITLSQQFETTYETVEIVSNRSIYLNGGLRSQFGGKSRVTIPIDLPENTVKWFYSFTTKKGKGGTRNLNLALQLSSLFLDPSTTSAQVLSNIKIPEGSSSADIYLLQGDNDSKFILKQPFYYNKEGTVENTKFTTVNIDDITYGRVYLGLKNPSSTTGVNIFIEAVAIVRVDTPIMKSADQKKAELYGNLGWKQFENGKYQKCIDYSNMSLELFELGWVKANKGLAQLMLGKEVEATETYIDAILLIEKQPNSQYFLNEITKDLERSILSVPHLPGAKEILDLLKRRL